MPAVAGYIARWRPSSVSPEAAAFARDVITTAGPRRAGAGEEPAVGGGQARRLRIGLGLDAVPEVLLHPSVTERFTRCAPGLSGVARRTLRTNLRFIGRRVVPQLYPQDMPLPGNAPSSRTARRRSTGSSRWRTPSPPSGAADARGRAGLPGRRRRADPRRPARRARQRRGLPVRRGRDHRARRPAPRGAGAGPLPRPAAGGGAFRRGRAGHRRDRSGPPEHHEPADRPRWTAGAGCRGWTPSRLRATWLAGLRGACWGWPRSCTRPGSAAPSGSAT